MKKLLLVLTFCLFLAGCGNDKLVCTKDDNVTGESSKVVYEFKDKKLETVKSTVKFETESEATDACNTYNAEIATDDEARNEYAENRAVCNGKKMTIIVSGRKYDDSQNIDNIEDIKVEHEKQGWSCE